jgi:hypothetical protein
VDVKRNYTLRGSAVGDGSGWRGQARKANADFLFYAMTVFFQERLLKP